MNVRLPHPSYAGLLVENGTRLWDVYVTPAGAEATDGDEWVLLVGESALAAFVTARRIIVWVVDGRFLKGGS